jgi:thiosulfate/3-mercaptopyruvate sulfurtransferase
MPEVAVELPGPLAPAAWLAAHLGEVRAGALVLADVRWVRGGSALEAFERGHLPGAVSLDLDRDLAAPAFEGPGRHPLPAPGDFAERMGAAGIGDATPVVAYDEVRGSVAGRLWWMLDALGHPAALLDGGIEAWTGGLETGPGRPCPPARFTPRPWPRERLADAGDVSTILRERSGIVIDVRAGERYRGEFESIDPVAGHIPGAINVPWTETLEAGSGSFTAPERVRERLEREGVDPSVPVVVQCGSGVTACHAALALRRAGIDARVYEGSWSDWISDPGRPVATGADPGEPG